MHFSIFNRFPSFFILHEQFLPESLNQPENPMAAYRAASLAIKLSNSDVDPSDVAALAGANDEAAQTTQLYASGQSKKLQVRLHRILLSVRNC